MIEGLTGSSTRAGRSRGWGGCRAGYYAWRGRPDSPRTLRRIWLAGRGHRRSIARAAPSPEARDDGVGRVVCWSATVLLHADHRGPPSFGRFRGAMAPLSRFSRPADLLTDGRTGCCWATLKRAVVSCPALTPEGKDATGSFRERTWLHAGLESIFSTIRVAAMRGRASSPFTQRSGLMGASYGAVSPVTPEPSSWLPPRSDMFDSAGAAAA